MAVAVDLSTRIVRVGTGTGVLSEKDVATSIRFGAMPDDTGLVAIIDLEGTKPTPAALRQLLVPMREAMHGWGNVAYVISSADEATREIIGWIANANDVGVYVTSSPEHLADAEPAGELSASEAHTLDELNRLGGTLTASDLSVWIGLPKTAAGNRLVNLARKGYVLRVQRPRQKGDLFVDPRTIRPHSAVLTN
jgi:hypothetical protein